MPMVSVALLEYVTLLLNQAPLVTFAYQIFPAKADSFVILSSVQCRGKWAALATSQANVAQALSAKALSAPC